MPIFSCLFIADLEGEKAANANLKSVIASSYDETDFSDLLNIIGVESKSVNINDDFSSSFNPMLAEVLGISSE